MSDYIISPDGKFMWSGSEWIPVPPISNSQSANVSKQDSGPSTSGVGEIGPQPSIKTDFRHSSAAKQQMDLAREAIKQGNFSEWDHFEWLHRALLILIASTDARDEGDYIEQSKCVKISLAIYKGLGEREEVAKLLLILGNIAIKLGDQRESHRFYTEAAHTMREIGVPVSQQLLDEGY
jgi:hypothetical protein